MKFLSVDRIEDGYIICESDEGDEYLLDFCDFSGTIQEGSILILNENGKWIKSEELTNKRRKMILELREEIYEKNQW